MQTQNKRISFRLLTLALALYLLNHGLSSSFASESDEETVLLAISGKAFMYEKEGVTSERLSQFLPYLKGHNLTGLYLRENNLKTLPLSLGQGLKTLLIIDLRGNPLESVPEQVMKFTSVNLTFLHLPEKLRATYHPFNPRLKKAYWDKYIETYLVPEYGTVDFSSEAITNQELIALGEALKGRKDIKNIHLAENDFTHIPEDFASSPTIERIILGRLKRDDIPKAIQSKVITAN